MSGSTSSAPASSDEVSRQPIAVHVAGAARIEPPRMRVNIVRFAPCSRTATPPARRCTSPRASAWSSRAAARSSSCGPATPPKTPPGEWHWHSAAPDHFMAHPAMCVWGDPDVPETEWGEQVTDDEYRAHPAIGWPGPSQEQYRRAGRRTRPRTRVDPQRGGRHTRPTLGTTAPLHKSAQIPFAAHPLHCAGSPIGPTATYRAPSAGPPLVLLHSEVTAPQPDRTGSHPHPPMIATSSGTRSLHPHR